MQARNLQHHVLYRYANIICVYTIKVNLVMVMVSIKRYMYCIDLHKTMLEET